MDYYEDFNRKMIDFSLFYPDTFSTYALGIAVIDLKNDSFEPAFARSEVKTRGQSGFKAVDYYVGFDA